MSRSDLSKQIDKDILDLYYQNVPVKDIATKIGLTHKAVEKRMEKIDYEPRSRAYPIDPFWLIENKDMMYILGYIFADGNVSSDKLYVTLGSKDIDHLEKVASILGKRVRVNSENFGTIGIGGRLLGEYLGQKYGLFPRKSRDVKFPFNISQSLLIPFIRGYFDGNGWVTVGKKVSCGFSSGSVNFLRNLSSALFYSGVDNPKFRDQKTEWGQAYSLNYGGVNRLRKIRDVLYEDATLFMERKYKKFLSI